MMEIRIHLRKYVCKNLESRFLTNMMKKCNLNLEQNALEILQIKLKDGRNSYMDDVYKNIISQALHVLLSHIY